VKLKQFVVRERNILRPSKFVVDGTINGHRFREFFRTKEQAQFYAEAKNIELKNFGQNLAEMPITLRAEALACVEWLRPFNLTLTQAVKAHLATIDQKTKSVTVEFAWAEFRKELERRVAANEISESHLVTVSKAGRKLVEDFGKQYICEPSPQVLKSWLTRLRSKDGQPLTATTKNNVKNNLSVIFGYAKEHDWLKANPIAEVKSFNDHRIKTKPPGILTPEEARLLLEKAEPEIVPFFAIGLFVGLRVAELERLDWSEIDFSDKTINVSAKKAKTAQPRWPEMSENLIEWLLPYRKTDGPIAPKPGRQGRIERARRAAGIAEWGNDKANALRHSFCSYHLALHKDAGLTAHEAGHMDSKTVYKHYNNRVKPPAAERYFAIRPQDALNILKVA
jgi:integrase